MQADYGMLLARTDFSVPKHHGISWFAFPLDQPGVTIRPLREMTGDAVFNEVFLDDAVCDAADLIGGAGNGWAVTQTTLYFERTGIGAGGSHAGFPDPGPEGRHARTARRRRRDRPDAGRHQDARLRRSASRSRSRATAPATRTSARISPGSTRTRKLGQWNAQRAKAEAAQGGGQAIANLGKIAQTRIVKHSAAARAATSSAPTRRSPDPTASTVAGSPAQ